VAAHATVATAQTIIPGDPRLSIPADPRTLIPIDPRTLVPGDSRTFVPNDPRTLITNDPRVLIPDDPRASGCGILRPGSDSAPSGECLACHGRLSHGGHPYDLDAARWGGRTGPGALRPMQEALRRGVFLPDGQIRCVTCHDGTSPWRYWIRLPVGSPVRPAVDPKQPATYENVNVTAQRPLRRGDDVGRKPLCLACHALD
jgi:hypothetical protein